MTRNINRDVTPPNQQPTSLSHRVCLAMALASLGAAVLSRLIIWLGPGDTANWTWSNIPLALAAIAPDMILIALLLICKIIADKMLAGRRRTVADYGLATMFWLLILVSAANLMSFLVMRAPLDLGWLRYLNARDAQTVGAMMTSAVTPKRVTLVIAILFILPILAIQLIKYARVLQKSMTLFICSAFLMTGSGVAGFTHSKTTDPLKDHSRRSGSIFTVLRKAFFPPNTLRYLNGEIGISPGAESNVDLADWQSKPAGTGKPCCVGMNIVQITIDSVPRRSINPEYILKNAALYPNLARLYQEGIGYTAAYSNRPSSAAALAVMALSDYPQNWWQRTSSGGLRLGDGDSLSAQLIRKGYEASHFMSGQVNYGGLRDQLEQWGFSTIMDSRQLKCGAKDDQLTKLYSHSGDACVAQAAAQWIERNSKAPFYAWVWFTNPHTPYYNIDDPFRLNKRSERERHQQAVKDTDKAIGELLAALDRKGIADKTIILLSADHGEAFGEHGLIYHATAIFEEQIGIPLIIKAPGMKQGIVDGRPASLIDFAPTLAWLTGADAAPKWRGTSLFAPNRPERVYFNSIDGGRMAGYRQGDDKYLITEDLDAPLHYNLATDPLEKRPRIVEGKEAELVAARIGAFTRQSGRE